MLKLNIIPSALQFENAHSKEPEEQLIYRRALPSDADAILEFMVENFYPEEPCSQALGIPSSQLRPLYIDLIDRCLQFPFSTVVISQSSGELAAILMNSIWRRSDVDGEGADYEAKEKSEGMEKFVELLNQCHADFWALAGSEVNVVIHREVSSVAKRFQRRGIATKMLTTNMEPEQLEKFAVDGVISETSSFANQILLEKNGFKCLKEIPYTSVVNSKGEQILKAHDGADGLRMNLKLIRDFDFLL